MRGLRILAFLVVAVISVSLISFGTGKIAIVLDVSGRGDLAFNDMGFRGANRAAEEFGLEMVEVQSTSAAAYLSSLRNCSRSGEYDLIIAVGFLLADALATVAEEFPEQKFAIMGADWVTGPNVMSFVFRENEMAALIGCLATLAAAEYGYNATGVVLGIPIPVLFHYEAGYRYGADWALRKYQEFQGEDADVAILYDYTGTFSDIARGKAASESMLAQGAVGIFNVAGPLGVGDLEAVAEFHERVGTTYGPPYYFGVDINQDWMGLGQHALASAMIRAGVATYTAVQACVEGTFDGGVVSLGLAEGAVGISKREDLDEFIDFGIAGGAIQKADRKTIIENWLVNRSTIPEWIWDAVRELEEGILAGATLVPTANTSAEIAAIRRGSWP